MNTTQSAILRLNPVVAVRLLIVAFLASISFPAKADKAPAGFVEKYADVNGVRLHYYIGGSGSAVVLLHGYAQTSHMWNPIMPLLAQNHTVIVPDLRGAGDSSKPESGYDKKNMAVDIHDLVTSLKIKRASIVGHDIGLMVAYAYAAQFPKETERLALMDAFLPGIGDWKNVWLMRDLWHFHFYGTTPLALVKGRERTYFEHFWNDFAADPRHSVSEADRKFYAKEYAKPGGMRAGFEYFKSFERDAKEFEALGATKLSMPVLVLTGEKASGAFLIEQARLVAMNVDGKVVPGSGHWLMDEAPQITIPSLVTFIDGGKMTYGDSRRYYASYSARLGLARVRLSPRVRRRKGAGRPLRIRNFQSMGEEVRTANGIQFVGPSAAARTGRGQIPRKEIHAQWGGCISQSVHHSLCD